MQGVDQGQGLHCLLLSRLTSGRRLSCLMLAQLALHNWSPWPYPSAP